VSLIDLVDSLSAFASVAVQNMCPLVISKSWYSAYYICNIIQGDRGHVLPIEISSDELLVMCVNGMFHCTLYLRFIVLFYSSIFRALGAFCQLQRIVSGDTGNV
jgi:hypothetical protein